MRRLLQALATAYAVTAYTHGGQGFEEPAHSREEAALPATTPPPNQGDTHPIDDVLERTRSELLAIPGFAGVGHGQTPDGNDAIIVWVTDPGAAERVPTEIEGYTVIVNIVPGGFRAYEGQERFGEPGIDTTT
jgi:hypothetical protein